jgi:hypothetical protein
MIYDILSFPGVSSNAFTDKDHLNARWFSMYSRKTTPDLYFMDKPALIDYRILIIFSVGNHFKYVRCQSETRIRK